MHSVQHPDIEKERRTTTSFRLSGELRRRVKIVAASMERSCQELTDEAIDRYVTEKERELGLPQQTKGAA